MRQALDETDAEVYVLRSTVPPSTTEKLRQEIGCSKLQGYFFCKPIPFEEIVERYEKNIQIGFEGLSFVPGYVHYLRRIENPRNPCGI